MLVGPTIKAVDIKALSPGSKAGCLYAGPNPRQKAATGIISHRFPLFYNGTAMPNRRQTKSPVATPIHQLLDRLIF